MDHTKEPEPNPLNITTLLNRMQKGDREAGNEVAGLVYGELRQIAARQMRSEQPGHLLQTTALVHEAYMKLVGARSLEIQDRVHFFAIASQQMRRILVDHARENGALRRGGGASRVDIESLQIPAAERGVEVLLLHESLEALEVLDPRAAKVVELRYFGGYMEAEVAEALQISKATVQRDWEFAKCWLLDRMRSKIAS